MRKPALQETRGPLILAYSIDDATLEESPLQMSSDLELDQELEASKDAPDDTLDDERVFDFDISPAD